MNIKQLTYFVEIVNNKGFTTAANKLYVCQSALSKTIKLLETELGTQLIDRSSKNFQLTDQGEMFYEYGEIALKNINTELDRLYNCINLDKGRLTVGIPPVICTAYFTSIIYEFRKKYPNITLNIVEAGANTVKDKVESAELDIGVVILPFHSEDFNITPAFSSDNVVLVHKEHPLAKRRSVAFRELEKESFIILDRSFMLYNRIHELCSSVGFKPNIVCESSQWDFIAQMVALNQGISILPRPIMAHFKSQDIRLINLTEPEFPWNIALIVKKDKYISTPIRRFIDFVVEADKAWGTDAIELAKAVN